MRELTECTVQRAKPFPADDLQSSEEVNSGAK